MENKKRTRSQTTLDAFVSVNLARSPLKQARSALRHSPPHPHTHRPPPGHTPPQPPPDARPRSPSPDTPSEGKLKRPSSPPGLSEPSSKRPRHDFPIFPARPSTSLPPQTNGQPASAYRRAVSVPAIPLLDLNNVPPSPRRSPTKFRIASVPPEPRSPDRKPPQLSIRPPSPPIPSDPQHASSSSSSPLSPLSPLPLTEDEPMPVDPTPTPSTSIPSRLPVATTISRMKPKPVPAQKKARSRTVAPSVRTTRSTTLRQKKVEEAKAAASGPSATPHRRRSMSLSSYAQPTAASAAKASPVKPASSRPSAVAPPSAAFTFTVTPRMSQLVPGAAAAGASSSSQKPRLERQSTAPLQLNSSLSTLNQALERLNAPAPTRPSTSMGFHREARASESEDDDGDRSALRSSTGTSGRPSSALAGAADAKGKSKLVPSTPSQLPKKTLTQTTLMLPPPLPAPDKAKARAESAASTTDSETDADESKKKRVGLALAPSLGKVRGSLGIGFARPPATPGAAGPSSTTTRPTSTGAAPQKRAFPAATPSSGRALFGGVSSGLAKPGPSTAGRPSLGAGRGGVAFGAGLRAGVGVGIGARRGGMAGRVLQRASKKSSLPVVEGSPVKGGGRGGIDADVDVMDAGEGSRAAGQGGEEEEGRTIQEQIGDWLRNADEDVRRGLGHSEDEDGVPAQGHEDANGNTAQDLEGPLSSDAAGPLASSSDGAGPAEGPNGTAANDHDKEKNEQERERERELRRNASRRASMASQLLSQSLSALPDTPPGPALKDKGKARAVSSSWPVPGEQARRAASADGVNGTQESANANGKEGGMAPPPVPPARPATRHNTRLATGALSTPPARPPEPGDSGGKGKGKEKEKGTESPGALAVLRGCTIFVDVRTEEGDDAGGLFVDMLRGLGAKMATRVGSRCTHVVYKNGLMSTLTRYRLLKEPKPLVVGIAWVVECVEQRQRVAETRFLVDLEMANVAGVNRRRKSMLPRNVFASPDGKTGWMGFGAGAASGPGASPASSDSSFRASGPAAGMGLGAGRAGRSFAGDRSVEVSSPTALPMDDDGDSSMQSNGAGPVLPAHGGTLDDEESLPPLEKARRRRSMLPTR